MAVFKNLDGQHSGRLTFDEFKDGFRRGFHEPSQEQTKLLRDFFYQLTGGSPTLDFRKFLIGLALVNENEAALKASDAQEQRGAPTQLPIEALKGKIYAQLAFAAFASEAD